MSFSYPNGLPASSRSSYGGFEEPNGYASMMSFHEEFKPQIYRVRQPFRVDAMPLYANPVRFL